MLHEGVLRLRLFNELMLFSACVWKCRLFVLTSFSSHRRTGTSPASNLCQNKNSRQRRSKHLETACDLGKQSRARADTKHIAEGDQATRKLEHTFLKWTLVLISVESHHRCILERRSVFEKTWRRRRWCSAKNPAVPFSKCVMWNSSS